MQEGKSIEDRQAEAILLRLNSDAAVKVSLFWDVLCVGALVMHIRWLAIVFVTLAGIYMIASLDLEHRANKLWPDPRDFNNGQN